MKKYFFLTTILITIIGSLSFTLFTSNPEKRVKATAGIKTEIPQCSCNTPIINNVSTVAGSTTFTWSPISGAVAYSFGGFYKQGSGFSYCTTSTSITISTNSGGTAQVRAICGGTCANATCSSNPSSPTTF